MDTLPSLVQLPGEFVLYCFRCLKLELFPDPDEKLDAACRRWLRRNGGYVFEGGYGEILRRYALRAKEPPVHPFADDRPDETVPTAAY